MDKIKDIKDQVDYYANLPYKVIVERFDDQGVYYLARVLELPDLIMTGATPAEAIAELESVKRDWMETYLKLGNSMPQPLQLRRHSGDLRIRMRPSLHSSLAERAATEGVSLNQYINTVLAHDMGIPEGHSFRAGNKAAGKK